MQTKDDQELIAQTLDGDHVAYATLVDRYKSAVYRHSFAIIRDEDKAEDIAQETFIQTYYKLKSFDHSRKFSTWLFKIATNKALDHLRKHKHDITLDDDLIERLESRETALETWVYHLELHAAVAKLRPEYCAVVSLYYWQGYSYRDIASLLNVPEGSVKGWMRRAKNELRKELT